MTYTCAAKCNRSRTELLEFLDPFRGRPNPDAQRKHLRILLISKTVGKYAIERGKVNFFQPKLE